MGLWIVGETLAAEQDAALEAAETAAAERWHALLDAAGVVEGRDA